MCGYPTRRQDVLASQNTEKVEAQMKRKLAFTAAVAAGVRWWAVDHSYYRTC